MKNLILPSLGLCLIPTFASAISFSQFFNNDNETFVESQSARYNWSSASANNIVFEADDISGGNTNGEISEGEANVGRGFFYLLPQDSSQGAGAVFMFTNHSVVSNVFQNNPQPDWFSSSSTPLSGLTLGEINSLNARVRPGSAGDFESRIGIEVAGEWYLSSSVNLLSSTSWTDQSYDNLLSEVWIRDAFVGGVLDADVSDNPTTTLSASDVVTGYGFYADVEDAVGRPSRIRLDQYDINAVVPEPSAFALLTGILALGLVARRR